MRRVALIVVLLAASYAFAQPSNPLQPYGSTVGEKQRAREYDKDGDHVRVNLQILSGTPTPGPTDRCYVQCQGATPVVGASIAGAPFTAFQTTAGVGCGCPGTGTDSTKVGISAEANGTDAVAVGHGTLAGANYSTAVGEGAVATGASDTAIGRASTASGGSSIAIGADATAAGGGIALGDLAAAGAGQFVVGSAVNPITSIYCGNSVASNAPENCRYRGVAGSGTNIAGGATILYPGPGTGNAKGGDVIFEFCAPGTSGSSTNSCNVSYYVDGTSGALIPTSATLGTAASPWTGYFNGIQNTGVFLAKQGSTQVVVAGSTILHSTMTQSISAASPLTITATPTLTDGSADQILLVRNDGANAITLNSGSSYNLFLDGNTTKTLHTGDVLMLQFNASLGDWYQLAALSHNHA